MKQYIKKHESKLRFGLIGSCNTIIDFSLLFLGTSLGLNHYIANYISTSAAFGFSFFANRTFTFKSKGSIKKQLLPFLAVTLAGMWILQPLIIWLMLMPLQGLEENIALFFAKVTATFASLIWNYLLYSKVVFK